MTKKEDKQITITTENYEMLEVLANEAGKTVDELAYECLDIHLKADYERAKKKRIP